MKDDFAQFFIGELDALMVRVAFEVAKAGDMVVFTEGGKFSAVLTNSNQQEQLRSVKQDDVSAYVCHSFEEFDLVLREWYAIQKEYAMRCSTYLPKSQTGEMNSPGDTEKRQPSSPVYEPRSQATEPLEPAQTNDGPNSGSGLNRSIGDQHESDGITWIPGMPNGPRQAIYIEAMPKETTAAKHQTRVYQFVRKLAKEKAKQCSGSSRPSGIFISEFWRLETPEGKAFYAYGYGGSTKEYWAAIIQEFARADGRLIGWISDSNTFVQKGGCSFPLADCKASKAFE